MLRVVILQHRLLHYRVRLFELLRLRLGSLGIELLLVYGQASEAELARRDEGVLGWATKVKNRYFRVKGKDFLWQPAPAGVRTAELVILLQENRILSNYGLQLFSSFRGQLIAFWGHGRNYQTTARAGLSERWKGFWLRRVDWWFAYTGSSARYLQDCGFQKETITVLDNAVDVSSFTADIASIRADELLQARQQLGIQAQSEVAVYCGSIYFEKRIDTLLRAADILRASLADFHLLVVGDGPEAHIVKSAAISRPWLHVRGIRIGRDKALDYRLASVVVNPGAVGLHIVDSFAARVPLITQTSALHGPEYDYLENGVNGLSVDDDSPESYAAGVADLFGQPTLLATMQARCAADAQRYTVEHMAQNFADGIVACLVRHGRLPAAGAVTS